MDVPLVAAKLQTQATTSKQADAAILVRGANAFAGQVVDLESTECGGGDDMAALGIVGIADQDRCVGLLAGGRLGLQFRCDQRHVHGACLLRQGRAAAKDQCDGGRQSGKERRFHCFPMGDDFPLMIVVSLSCRRRYRAAIGPQDRGPNL